MIELGAIDLNRSASCRFTVGNCGGSPLVIHSAVPGCHCQGVFREAADGTQEAVKNLSIPPGAVETFGLSFAVSGLLGQPTAITVDLSTNDPQEPAARVLLRYTPTARLYCVPQAVVFGDVPTGSPATASIDVYADGRQERVNWDRAECSPASYRIHFDPTPLVDETLSNSIASRIGHLTVTFLGSTEAHELQDVVVVSSAGKEVVRLPVSGRCVPPVILTPGLVRLPRASSQGPVYAMTVACRARSGEPVALAVRAPHPDFAVESLSSEAKQVHIFQVVYRGTVPAQDAVRGSIGFAAIVGGATYDCRLDVAVASPIEGLVNGPP